jgi:hypothetical protein
MMEIRNLTRRKPCIIGGNAGMTDSEQGQFIYRRVAIECVKELEEKIEILERAGAAAALEAMSRR